MALNINLVYAGKPLHLPTPPTPATTLAQLRACIANELQLPPSAIRLVARGKFLPPARDTDLLSTLDPFTTPSTKPYQILILATAPSTIPKTPPSHSQPLVVATPRRTVRNQSSSTYGFASLHPLPGFADEHVALSLLQRLSTDHGILTAMRLRNWRVGQLAELPAVGRVGIDPVCVLGLNVGRGSKILLRLRTDDGQGFRSMKSLRHVLAHELAHIVEDEHNTKFKEEMRWVERTADGLDWRGTGGRVLENGTRAREVDWRDELSSSQHAVERLGGGSSRASRLLKEFDERKQREREDGGHGHGHGHEQGDGGASKGDGEDRQRAK